MHSEDCCHKMSVRQFVSLSVCHMPVFKLVTFFQRVMQENKSGSKQLNISLLGSHTILVFSQPVVWQYSDGDP